MCVAPSDEERGVRTMSAAAFLAEATLVANEHSDLPSKWFFGGFALVALLALLFVVTRVNIDR
jgi:hypothetical protein